MTASGINGRYGLLVAFHVNGSGGAALEDLVSVRTAQDTQLNRPPGVVSNSGSDLKATTSASPCSLADFVVASNVAKSAIHDESAAALCSSDS